MRSIYQLLILALLIPLPGPARENTWLASPARVQLYQDPTLIPTGKGFLFVPAMTAPRNEPNYQVFKGKKEIASRKPGTGVLLDPGSYSILIGSGAGYQMIKKTVPISEGMTTLVKPNWSGLVIDVIDETRTSINETYELFEDETRENLGLGRGVEEERGEMVDTWILKAGMYNIVRVGENITTTKRFSVRLLPGELSRFNLVVNSKTNEFVGFYPQRQITDFKQISKHWKSTWELSGATLFNTSHNTASEDRSSVSLSIQVHNRTTYSSKKNFANLRLILEEGGNKEERQPFSKSIDKFELRATYIYRLSRRIGPYMRGVLNTTLFATDELFDEPRNFLKLDTSGDTLSIVPNTSKVTLSPPFFPLTLRQGLGINSQLIQSFPLNVNMRLGLGTRQTYRSDSFEMLNANRAQRLKTATSIGIEALLITEARIGRFVVLDSEFDLLLPGRSLDTWVFSLENRWRIFLTSFINIDIVADLKREKGSKLQATEQVLLRFSKFL